MFLSNLEKGTDSQNVPTRKFKQTVPAAHDNLTKEYQKFLQDHGFSEMNCPFTSFLRRKELNAGIEAGAL